MPRHSFFVHLQWWYRSLVSLKTRCVKTGPVQQDDEQIDRDDLGLAPKRRRKETIRKEECPVGSSVWTTRRFPSLQSLCSALPFLYCIYLEFISWFLSCLSNISFEEKEKKRIFIFFNYTYVCSGTARWIWATCFSKMQNTMEHSSFFRPSCKVPLQHDSSQWLRYLKISSSPIACMAWEPGKLTGNDRKTNKVRDDQMQSRDSSTKPLNWLWR